MKNSKEKLIRMLEDMLVETEQSLMCQNKDSLLIKDLYEGKRSGLKLSLALVKGALNEN